MQRTARLAPLLAALVAWPIAAAADERILEYHADITVETGRDVVVTERITVRAEGKEIKRGIYRELPTRYRTPGGWSTAYVPYEVVSVRRDGKQEGWHTDSGMGTLTIYMGRKNARLDPGVYTYELTYRTRWVLGLFDDHDELYWNVTGNEWAFPIDKASATVTLPDSVPPGKVGHEAYTGPEGAKGRDYTSRVDDAGRAHFATTRPLSFGEGLTVVVTWPKGHITPPTDAEKARRFLRDNGAVMAALIGLIVVAGYFLLAWIKVGRDPAAGVVIPEFAPPEGLDPAAVRYISRMGFDRTAFAAEILSLAVKGRLRIEDEGGSFALVRETDDLEGLTAGEAEVQGTLLGTYARLALKQTFHRRFRNAMKGLKRILADEHKGRGKLFVSNVGWLVGGVVLSVLALLGVIGTAFFAGADPSVAFLGVWLTFWSVGVFFLVHRAIRTWRGAIGGRGAQRVKSLVGAIFLTLFSIPFVGAEIAVLVMFALQTSIWVIPLVIALLAVNAAFQRLLKQPTQEGRKVMDRIDGFRMYLATAERDLLDAATPPEKTPELFEAFLPYAVALDVENAWAGKFEGVLGAATAVGEGGYRPSWYRGAAWGTLGAAGFASSLNSSFTSALSSASTAPGSSSGSGGGGSSGGGGGGGGGGGW